MRVQSRTVEMVRCIKWEGHPDFRDMQMWIKSILIWRNQAAGVKFCLVKHSGFHTCSVMWRPGGFFFFFCLCWTWFEEISLFLGTVLILVILELWPKTSLFVLCASYSLLLTSGFIVHSWISTFLLINLFKNIYSDDSELHETGGFFSSWSLNTYLGIFRL